MADPSKPVAYQNGEPVYDNASPGVGGAIKDFVGSIAKAVAPKAITEAPQREQEQEDDAQGLGRMRAAQSSDRDNSYSY